MVLSIHVTGFVGAIHFNIVWHGSSYWFIGHLFFFLLLLPENLTERGEKRQKSDFSVFLTHGGEYPVWPPLFLITDSILLGMLGPETIATPLVALPTLVARARTAGRETMGGQRAS